MKTLFTLAATVAFVVGSFATVNAQETSEAPAKCEKCPASQTAVASTDQEGEACCDNGPCTTCVVSAAMANLPKMTYKVGEEATCCPEGAAELAKTANAPIHFVVGEKVFEAKEEAFVALVESTEAMVNEFVTPTHCEKSGNVTIAGKACNCPVEAGKKAEIVKAAVESVQVSYKVGEESCGCAVKAGELAKTSGEKMIYVVGGEETCCNMTARLNTARAKYEAVVKSLVAAETPATDAEPKTEG